MSDEGDQEQRTEAPSDRRLQQAFDQGDIALSRDVASAAAFIAGIGTLIGFGKVLEDRLARMVGDVIVLAPKAPFASLLPLVMPVVAPAAAAFSAMAVAGVALTFAQTRGHVWLDKATPDLSRVFSTERLTRLVSKDFAIDLVTSIAKASVVGWVIWTTLRAEFLTVGRLTHAQPAEQLAGLFRPLATLGLRTALVLALLAGADLALSRWRHRKKLMMTREELKREMKEDEGDPQMKGARKRKHRELSKKNALAETRRADAIIVNPTHIAIAVRYRKDEGGAPRVLAKGKGVLAEAMREEARASGIPIVQDIPLARLLFKKVKVGGQVPADTYKAVAAILAFVYRLTGRAPAAAGREAAQ